MPSLRVGDVDLYYEVRGSGEPVLLVPASWWPLDAWNVDVVPLLSQQFQTIVFDCRGTGRSSQPEGRYSVPQFARDALELLAQLGILRCHAVGFALGGQIVQAMAIEKPALVASATIAACGSGARTLSGGPRRVSAETTREISSMGFEAYIRGYIENDVTAFSRDYYRNHPENVKALADAVWSGQSTPEMFRRHEDARLTWDTVARAPEVKVPSLILCGADDDVNRRGSTPVNTAKRLAQAMPGAELALVPNVKHMTFWDGSAALTALADFLARHPISPGR
jgi:3-oxoadipate enol-lactonase